MKMRSRRAELSLAAAISSTLLAAQAGAQDRAEELEEVVVTGSFIPTLPEDAAIPVEVFNYEDLKDMGRPSNIDMIKGLTEIGQSIGEIDRQTGYPIDAATVNLRNLGPRFTTVVFNNRRFPEQYSPATGRFNNVASIPNAAIGNVEVLKSGGAAIYGADAVAGVVNYITRKDVTGLEVNTEYMYIPDSDGDYNVDGVWGKKFDGGGNFLISAAYQHRSSLERFDRDWSFREYLENPTGWHTYGGAYAAQNGTAATGAGIAIVPPQGPGLRQRGATGVMRDPACEAMGGYSGFSTTGSAICYADYTPTERLVEESDSYSLFSELNKNFGGLDFHLEGLAYYRELPEISVMSRNGPLTFPLTGAAYTSGSGAGQYDRYTSTTGTPGSGGLTGTPMYSVAGTNPAVRHYLESMALNQNGSRAYTPAQIAAITGTGRIGLLQTLWAPVGFGGNPLGEDFDVQKNTTTQWRVSTSLGGDLPSFLGTELEWEVAFTYHYTKDTRRTNDIPTYKLQNALNGFGGAGCTQNPMPGAGGVAGAAGCYYLNPFSSSYARSAYNGAANPFFVGSGSYTGYAPGAGLQNNPDMLRWLYETVSLDRTYKNTIVDPIIRGTTGIDLPGGPIQIALGGQFRRQDEEVNISDNVDRELNPCPHLPNGARTLDCTPGSRTGGMALSRATTVLGSAGNNHRDERRHYPVAAGFMQFKLPILNTLNADIVGRYEKFYSDVTDVDNSVAVPAVAVKWDPLDWLSFRTSWGKTFSQVNPPEEAPPVRANGTTPVNPFATNSYPNLDVEPEKGTNFSVGFLIRAGNFSATVDYNAITIDDYARTLTANNIVTAMLVDRTQNTSATALINCDSPLLSQNIPGLANQPYARLNGNGVCTPGFSRLNSTTDPGGDGYNGLIGGTVNYFGGTGQTNAGELISNALDLTMSYTFDNVFGGTLIPSFDITYVTKYEFEDFIVAGVTVAPGYDGVGYRNDSTGRLGQGVPDYRAGFGLLYRKDRHAVNLLARYVPSVINEDEADFNATVARNANIGPDSSAGCPATGTLTSNLGEVPAGAGTAQYGATCAGYNTQVLSGRRIESYFNLDLIYRVNVTDALSMSLNISNVTDEDPSFAREQIAYDSGYGSPLGRTFELGASYKF
jgi:iron complex outermembrane recepter protein